MLSPLYAFSGQVVPDVLAGMVGGTVDADHMRVHWDAALRLAVSVSSGHASASGMLRRLAAYPFKRLQRKLATNPGASGPHCSPVDDFDRHQRDRPLALAALDLVAQDRDGVAHEDALVVPYGGEIVRGLGAWMPR